LKSHDEKRRVERSREGKKRRGKRKKKGGRRKHGSKEESSGRKRRNKGKRTENTMEIKKEEWKEKRLRQCNEKIRNRGKRGRTRTSAMVRVVHKEKAKERKKQQKDGNPGIKEKIGLRVKINATSQKPRCFVGGRKKH